MVFSKKDTSPYEVGIIVIAQVIEDGNVLLEKTST